jgi:flagellar basal body-associated protein FliL
MVSDAARFWPHLRSYGVRTGGNDVIWAAMSAVIAMGLGLAVPTSVKTALAQTLAKADAETSDPGQTLPDFAYIRLEPMHIAVVRDGRKLYQMLFDISLEVPNRANRERIAVLMPKIRDAFIRELYGAANLSNAFGPAHLDRIKRQLLARCERIVGPGMVSDVLIGQALRVGR